MGEQAVKRERARETRREERREMNDYRGKPNKKGANDDEKKANRKRKWELDEW